MELFKESFILLWTSPLIALAILLELFLSNQRGIKVYSLRGVLENIYLTSLNLCLDLLVRSGTFWVFSVAYDFHVVDWPKGLLYWGGLLLAQDFAYYWLHRLDHQCRLFWAIHVTHHSAKEFNLTVGFRSSVFQPLYRFLFFIPLCIIGWSPFDIFIMYSITQLYGILLHTELIDRLGWLEYILVTPSHHRVHHGSNPEYIDRNFGMVLIIWDKLFGTFTLERAPVCYGITKPLSPRNAVNLVFHEWRELIRETNQIRSLKMKVKFLLDPPGSSSSMPVKQSETSNKR